MIHLATSTYQARASMPLRGWLVVFAAAAIGAVALAVTLLLTAVAVVAVALWAAVSLLWRGASPILRRRSPRTAPKDLHLEGRRTPEGWTVEAV